MPFRPIHCPYCGLELQVPEDASQVTCMYCAKPIDLKALFCPADEAPSSGLQLQQALSPVNTDAVPIYGRRSQFYGPPVCGRLCGLL